MIFNRRFALKAVLASLSAVILPLTGNAQDETPAGPVVHEIHMYTRHPEDKKQTMVFVPDLLVANPGDVVRFIPTEKTHNSNSDENMMPTGADSWTSKINEELEITLTKDGTYGFYCLPHRAMGMVGLLLVGDASVNYEEAKAAPQKGKAKKVYADIFDRADALLAQ